MLFQDNDFLLFTGDSITDAGRGRPVGEGLCGVGTGYVRTVDNLLNAFFPTLKLRIANTGNSGDTVRDLKKRWQTDVLDLKPDWLSLCIGVNDVWRQFDSPYLPHTQVTLKEYGETLDELVKEAAQQVKGLILMSPYFMEPNKQDSMRAMMDTYGAAMKKIADKYQVRFVDLQAVFDDYLQYHHSTYLNWDRVHPTGISSMLIARAFLKSVGLDLTLTPDSQIV